MSKKTKPKRRKRPPKVMGTTTSCDDELGTDSSGGVKTLAILFGIMGGLAGAVDGYKDGGLGLALFLMPFTAVFAAVLGVVAVYLRGIIAAVLLPGMFVLVIGVIAYEVIWGLPDNDAETDSVVEVVGE